MFAWNDFYNNLKVHTDAVGLECIDVLEKEVIPIDIALRNGDMATVAQILRKVIPHVNLLIPHLKDASLQQTLKDIADEAAKVVAILELKGGDISAFSALVESATHNLGGILKTLIHSVVHIVDNMLESIH